ncbi:hypothetical protein EVAR_42658_1 [Eumeta japonica]|uniref:Uncharacterized protein n=1 Tax=Eumeta variegata TaxID=151549 RepID=A0A4C1YQX2_EUMVA|nr:hypothetical protein EVAR_42658_1 [Eumeta japonica]
MLSAMILDGRLETSVGSEATHARSSAGLVRFTGHRDCSSLLDCDRKEKQPIDLEASLSAESAAPQRAAPSATFRKGLDLCRRNLLRKLMKKFNRNRE